MRRSFRARSRALSTLIAAVLVIGTAPTWAFSIRVHLRITNDSLRPLRADVYGSNKGFSAKALEQIGEANESVDSITKGSAALWHPERHFTNDAYQNSAQRIIDLRREVIQLVTGSTRDGNGARERLGWALHTIQDFYSHSNWVERGNASINYALGDRTMPNPARGDQNCPTNPNVLGPAGGGTLTSGYYLGFLGCSTDELPANKCFHGNYTRSCLGINKDLDAVGAAEEGVPQNPNHATAAQLAQESTRRFVQGILDDLKGNDKALAALLDVKGTLGFVVDDTGSMGSSISGVVGAINQIVDQTSSNPDLQPDNYLLVRFGDPDVGAPLITDDAAQLRSAVSALYPNGGGDCPELSQGALATAVDAAAPDSRLYLFTDATAKDSSAVNQVIARAQMKGTEINYGLTGSCSPIDQAYLRGAAETGGQVFRVYPSEIPKLFTVIEPQLKGNLAFIARRRVDLGAGGIDTISAPVDSQMSSLLVALSVAENNVAARHKIRVFNPSGAQVGSSDPGVRIETLSTGAIVRVDLPEPGEWKIEVEGYGPFTATVQGNSPLDIARFDFVQLDGDIHGGFDTIPGQPVVGDETTAEATVIGPYASAVFGFVDEAGRAIGEMSLINNYPLANSEHFLGDVLLPAVPFRVVAQGVDSAGKAYRREYPTLYRAQPVSVTAAGLRVIDVNAGSQKTIGFTVENHGPKATFINAAKDERGFAISASPASVTLEKGQKVEIAVALSVPANAEDGATSEIIFTTTNQASPSVFNSASTLVQVQTNRAPVCSGPVQVAIWPPNSSFHTVVVTAHANVTDPDGDSVTVRAVSVTQDEPTGGELDAEIAGGDVVRVRAERLGNGNGRVYQINYVATDVKGASCEGYIQAGVPHDRADGTAVDDGQEFESTVR